MLPIGGPNYTKIKVVYKSNQQIKLKWMKNITCGLCWFVPWGFVPERNFTKIWIRLGSDTNSWAVLSWDVIALLEPAVRQIKGWFFFNLNYNTYDCWHVYSTVYVQYSEILNFKIHSFPTIRINLHIRGSAWSHS